MFTEYVYAEILERGDEKYLRLNLNTEYDGITYSFAMNPDDPFVWKIAAITPNEVH